MRPPPFLSAAAIATLGATAFAQAPSRAPSAPPAAQPGPPQAPAPTAPSAPQAGVPPTPAPSAVPAAQPGAPSTPAPLPGASPSTPPLRADAPQQPGAPPSAPPPGPQPPVYGPPPPPAGPPPPGYPVPPYYSAPYGFIPPPPAVPLDAQSHTGFFLRLAFGGGYMANASTLEGPMYQGKVDAAGGAVALEVAIGGALSPGIILAGTYTVHTVGAAKLTNDTRTSSAGRYRPAHDPGLTMLAAMLDVYPNHKGGFHLGGALGFASLRVRADEDPLATDSGQNGFGIAPHVGYEWWVSNYWGLGVLGRFVFARTEGDYADGKEKDTVTAGAILFSATYN